MLCPICKGEINDNSQFCCKCGNWVPRCPTCGMPITRRMKFCTRDGTVLPQEMLYMLPEQDQNVGEFANPSFDTEQLTANLTGQLEDQYPQEPVQATRFCVRCGKPCGPGTRVCAACEKKKTKKSGSILKLLWIPIALMLLVGIVGTGVYVLKNDLIRLPDLPQFVSDLIEKESDVTLDFPEEYEEEATEKPTKPAVAPTEPNVVETTPPVAETTEPVVETTAATVPPETKPENPLAKYNVGDYVAFGHYEQDNNAANGKESIEWIVLDKRDDKMLVISRYALDCQKYNKKAADVTWETCSIRSWLNDNFYDAAFSKAEQKQILETTVTADKNPSYNTNAGSDTKDRVFLLSLSETNQYLTSNSARFCMPTAYAIKQNAYVDTSSGGCWWMMRTPGETGKKIVSTNTDGSIDYNGGIVESNRGGVRPAMWIDIS